jgi:hypothetical protein
VLTNRPEIPKRNLLLHQSKQQKLSKIKRVPIQLVSANP